ncbi:MAG: pantetheine-phosphate adenylyltransferase [Planctomycetota bacterium]|nr:pantetheine-phosphate adenylyltransferase [Planctomycetota bacterium]
MAGHKPTVALMVGVFDPITNGHVDVIRRVAAMFDRVIVGVGDNPEKSAMFTADQRAGLVRASLAHAPNVEVVIYRGLTIHFAAQCGATFLVRGIRNSTDLRFESDLAMTNRAAGGVETLYLPADPAIAYISSSLVRQIASGGGDASAMVPAPVWQALLARRSAGK